MQRKIFKKYNYGIAIGLISGLGAYQDMVSKSLKST